MCASFGDSLTRFADSLCVPHEDCLGIDCDVTIKKSFVRARLDVTLRVYPEQRRVTIRAGGKTQEVTGDGESKSIYYFSL